MTKKLPILLLLVCLQQLAFPQSTFFKTFVPDDYENFQEVIPIQDGYAFVTDEAYYRVNSQGNTVIKKVIKEGSSSFIGSIIPDGNGNYWLASHVFETIDIQKIKLYKISADGNILSTKDLGRISSIEKPKLVSANGNSFYLSYTHYDTATGDGHIDIVYFDANANKIWQKEMSQRLYTYSKALPGNNGTMDICFMTKDDFKVWVLSVDNDANSSLQEIHFQQTAGKLAITHNFCKVAGGGYVFVGAEIDGNNISDLIMYKAAANGVVEWIKSTDIYFNDQSVGIVPVNNGYIVLANAGNQGWGDEVGGDIVLVKTDLQGNQQWLKAYGSARSDYGSQILVNNDGSFTIGGRAWYPGQVVPIPMLCKTDASGNIATTMPLQLAPASDMKPVATSHQSPIQRMIQAANTNDGGFMLGANFIEKSQTTGYPFLVKNNKNGQGILTKKLLDNPATLKTLRQLKDGNYLAITEQKDLFANTCTAIKLNANGDTIWTSKFGASNVKDVVGTADGGCLITGSLDISFVNYEVLLIRLNTHGKILWQKTIGERAQWETGRRILETPENGFLIVGSNQKEFDIVADLHLLKIDKDGNKIFSKNFHRGIATSLGFDAIINTDNTYLLVGTENKQPFTNKNILLIKTDAQGNSLWQKTIDINLLDEGFSILPSVDGSFYISGTTGEPNAGKLEKYAYVLYVDANGNKLWDKYYGKEGFQTTSTGLLPDDDGVILLGNTQPQYAQERMFFVKVNGIPSEEPTTVDSLLLYPNPARSDGSSLFINNNYIGPLQIALYDAAGKRMSVINAIKNEQRFLEKISTHGLASAIYFLEIKMGDEKVVKRLVVTR